MKICTDATLFGAMAPVRGGERVLDIGTGCGLLALMLAQLGVGSVVGVELTEEAYREAEYNFQQSPWSNQLQAVRSPIQEYAQTEVERFDLIISNPPFFDNHTKTETHLRNTARHTDTLPFIELISAVNRLLTQDGLFYLLIPRHAVDRVSGLAAELGMYPVKQVDYANASNKQSKVSTLILSREYSEVKLRRLNIYLAGRIYSEEASHYLKSFLLRFAS